MKGRSGWTEDRGIGLLPDFQCRPARQDGGSKIPDDELGGSLFSGTFGRRRDRDGANSELVKELAGFGKVIQREDELALNALKTFLELSEVLVGEIELVQLAIPIRRIEVEQGRLAVVSFEDFFVGQ